MKKENMITRTLNIVTVKGKKLDGFNGTEPIFSDVTFTVKNPRATDQDTLRKAIKRNYGAKAERELVVIESVGEAKTTYGMSEEEFFKAAEIIAQDGEDTPTEEPKTAV